MPFTDRVMSGLDALLRLLKSFRGKPVDKQKIVDDIATKIIRDIGGNLTINDKHPFSVRIVAKGVPCTVFHPVVVYTKHFMAMVWAYIDSHCTDGSTAWMVATKGVTIDGRLDAVHDEWSETIPNDAYRAIEQFGQLPHKVDGWVLIVVCADGHTRLVALIPIMSMDVYPLEVDFATRG